MSEFDILKIAVPGITKPGAYELPKGAIQEYIYTVAESGRPVVIPVVRARLIMTEAEIRGDPGGSSKFVRVGPDMTLDLETRNNPSNVATLLDFMEHNTVLIYPGELAAYTVKDLDTYDVDKTQLPIVKLEHKTRRYIVFKDGRPYRSVDDLTADDPNPRVLHFEPIGKKTFIDGLGNEWTDTDNQIAANHRPRGNGEKLTYYRVPKISADIREEAVKILGENYPDRQLTGRDVLLDQFPEWDTLTEEEKARDPFAELVTLMRPLNMYDGIREAEYIRACESCITGVFVGSATRQKHAARVDVFPVLIGSQGAGKTTFCNFLGADISDFMTFKKSLEERAPFKGEIERSSSDESGNRHADNKIWERSGTKLVTEFLEGNALRRSTINTFKMIADKTTATFARLYEDEHEEPITSTFWVTTNESKPLHDEENRRFFPIWFGGDLSDPSPIVEALKCRSSPEIYDEKMRILYDILRVARAHARHLEEEGHTAQDYFTEEFVEIQKKINLQSVTSDPTEEKIGSMIRREAPGIIRDNSVLNKDGVDYAPISKVEAALKLRLSEVFPVFYRPDIAKAFNNAWAKRERYGVYKDPKGGGGYPRAIGGKTIRTVHVIDEEGHAVPWYQITIE